MIATIKAASRQFFSLRRSSPAVGSKTPAAALPLNRPDRIPNIEINGVGHLQQRLARFGFRTVLDVGAGYGDWTRACLRAWPLCEVHAFELAPRTAQELSRRTSWASDCGRLRLNDVGLSDFTGVARMYYFPDHPELTCDLPRHDLHAHAFSANLMTGDDYAAQAGFDIVDFVQIDVEGAELRVLNGMQRLLKNRAIQALQFEYGSFATDTRFQLADCYSLLEADYWIGRIHSAGVDFRAYRPEMEDFRSANYCCISKDRADLRKFAEGSSVNIQVRRAI